MHEWQVAGAVIEGPEGLLLVCNQRRDGSLDWSPPGGVIDDGEDVLTGLAREVLEETGLIVERWEGPLYAVTIDAPDLGWVLHASVHRAVSWSGELTLQDPDGIVVEAGFLADHQCAVHLAAGHPWVGEPLAAWLEERWVAPRRFGYRVEGAVRADARITRLPST